MQRRHSARSSGSTDPTGTAAASGAQVTTGNSKRKANGSNTVLAVVLLLALCAICWVIAKVQFFSMLASIDWSGVVETIGAPYSTESRQPSQPGQKQLHWMCADNDGENLARLIAHMHGCADVSAVELGYFKGVRGLQAARPIPKGHPVISVPFNATLSIATTSMSAAAAAFTSSWQQVEDADMHLDTLALLYESFVKGPASSWAPYICTIPRAFDLPYNQFSDQWSMEVVSSLPELHRLLAKRAAQVAQFESLVTDVMGRLPGGQDAMWREKKRGHRGFHKLHDWAYMAAKTRTITLDLEEVESHNEQVPLAPGFKAWLREFGVLVPVLDLANHAGGKAATTYFAVDFSSQSTANLKGSKPVFSLVAARDISEGEQITFSYLPEDDGQPHCNMRWLVEYGFIINDGQPGRDCYTFTATARELSNLLKGQANTDDTLSTALASQGMPDTWAVNLVRGSDQGVRQLSDWVAAAGVEPKQATCLLLGAHASKLGQQLEKSETSQEAVVGPGLSLHLREALLEVLRGAVRAVTDAMMQQGC